MRIILPEDPPDWVIAIALMLLIVVIIAFSILTFYVET